jgi:dephospho-CoA kinase
VKPYGLTGNIGCGKSTVAALLSKYPDTLVLDCDNIAKEMVSNSRYRGEVGAILGLNVFVRGEADFKAIAEIIFEDSTKRRQLEALIHPLVWSEVEKRSTLVPSGTIVIVESALIYETESAHRFSSIVVAACNPQEQLRRLRANREMCEGHILARQLQQLPSYEKERRAQFVIYTDCSVDQLNESVAYLYHQLKQERSSNHEQTKSSVRCKP